MQVGLPCHPWFYGRFKYKVNSEQSRAKLFKVFKRVLDDQG